MSLACLLGLTVPILAEAEPQRGLDVGLLRDGSRPDLTVLPGTEDSLSTPAASGITATADHDPQDYASVIVLDDCLFSNASINEGKSVGAVHGLLVLAETGTTDAVCRHVASLDPAEASMGPDFGRVAKVLETIAERPGKVTAINLSLSISRRFDRINTQLADLRLELSQIGGPTELVEVVQSLLGVVITPENVAMHASALRVVYRHIDPGASHSPLSSNDFARIDTAISELRTKGVSVFVAAGNLGPNYLNMLTLNPDAHSVGWLNRDGNVHWESAANSLVDGYMDGLVEILPLRVVRNPNSTGRHDRFVYDIDTDGDGEIDSRAFGDEIEPRARLWAEGSSFAAPKAIKRFAGLLGDPNKVEQALQKTTK